MNRGKHILITVLCCLITGLIVFAITYGGMLGKLVQLKASQDRQTAGVSELYDDAKLAEIESYVEEYFIGETDREQMTEKLAGAMIQGLGDEWSYYISADEYASYVESVNNSYVGIGVTITWEDEDPRGFRITDVTPDSPAYHAGIRIGDYMHLVEGEDVTALGMEETKNRVRGSEGTSVRLTLTRDGEDYTVDVVRARIQTVNVTYQLLEDAVGYIHIRNFDERCADDTIAAIEQLTAQGAEGLVFDVRFNPGGLKSELVELLDYLLPEGPIFRSVNYDGREYVDQSDARCLELPMAVIVNVDSYSAAEFFAAALQEYGAATVVGTQTYGKGYFQTTHLLSDGSAVHISTGKYYTPNGVSLVGVGITPDRVVEVSDETYADIYYSRLDPEQDAQLQEAIASVKK